MANHSSRPDRLWTVFVTLLVTLAGWSSTQSVPNGPNTNPSADFYVATNGNDAWPGTLSQPFRTVDRARLAVQSLKSHVVAAPTGCSSAEASTIFPLPGHSLRRTPEVPILLSYTPITPMKRPSSAAARYLQAGRRIRMAGGRPRFHPELTLRSSG